MMTGGCREGVSASRLGDGDTKGVKLMSWEYEALFDVEAPMHGEATLMDWISEGERRHRTNMRVGTMAYRTRTTVAGPRLEAEVYPMFGRDTSAVLRRAKKTNVTPERQARLNRERSIRHLVQLADANFTEQDIHLTLTYRNAPTYERARKDMRNFCLRLKRMREKRGLPDLKYIYTIEGDSDGRRERIHIHMITNGDMDRAEVERIWEKGYANADRLQPDENGLEAVVRYLVKQQTNKRKWCASRNLKQPKSRTSDSKLSNGRVKRIAFDIRNEAKAEMEKVYQGYQFVSCTVHYSDVVDGAYIRCVMRRKPGREGRR
jgi:hypothetical protein